VADVTLDKQPDGSWQATPAAGQSRSFSSWQRLWCVTGLIYLLMLAATCYVLVPTRERVERNMVFAVTEEVRRFDGMAFAGESPDTIFRVARSEGYSDWVRKMRARYRIGIEGDTGFNRIEKEYRESASSLTTKQVLAVLISGIAWIVPMVVLYAIGFTVDWIKRGVRVAR
jgi:hypothetical protein